jgi:two-component system CheB/CheR fusion protein
MTKRLDHECGEARRVLIIEDNVDAASSLREALELCDFQVRVAHDGVEGIELARRFKPDVVVCDIGLPGMDGYQVARAVRADGALDRIGLIALSGYALPADVERARAAGFDRHLAKPADLGSLERALDMLPSRAA